MTPIFDNSRKYPNIHVWCKFCDSSPNLWRVIVQTSQNSQNDLEGHGQWPLFSIPTESIPGCVFGVNLVNLTQICRELLRGQAEFPKIVSQNGQNDLEGQSQWPPFSIPAENIPGYMFSTDLVIPAQIVTSYRADKVKFTDRRTDGHTGRRRQQQCPFGLKGQGVKSAML